MLYLIARILCGGIRARPRAASRAFLTFAVQTWLAVGAVIGLVVKIART